MIFIGVISFFVTFYRLSLIFPNFYLSIFPSVLGATILLNNNIKNHRPLIIKRQNLTFIYLFFFIFFYCLALDFFQLNLTLNSSLSFRLLTIIIFSLLPAYFINQKIINGNIMKFKKIIYYAFIVQLFFFFLTYLIPSTKQLLFNIFGMSESVLLEDDFLQLRGFGLSAEINFMSPFLMVYISFLVFSKRTFLKLLISITQILNSNLVAIAVALGWISDKSKIYLKLFVIFFAFISYKILGQSIIQIYFPRLYSEFFDKTNDATSTNALINNHIFLVGKLDLFTLLFGFQQNVSSAAGESSRNSDIGWVVLFNYGGVILVIPFILLLYNLSFLIFKEKKLAILWFLIGLIFNSKGMIIGLNGYFFISFLFLFTNYFKSNVVK